MYTLPPPKTSLLCSHLSGVMQHSPERNGCSHSNHIPFPLCFKQPIKSVNCEWCELVHISRQILEFEKYIHPGSVICFYNLDIQVQRKIMSMQSQNRDYHWVNHQMIENRVSVAHQNSTGSKANLQEISNIRLLPTLEDQQCQRSNYIVLTSQILVDYFDALAPLKDVCILHIPHKFTNKMSQK